MNESSRDNILNVNTVNFGDNTSGAGISIQVSQNNQITVGHLITTGSDALAEIADPAYTGTKLSTNNNTIKINRVTSINAVRAGLFSNNGDLDNNTISINSDNTPGDGFNLYFRGDFEFTDKFIDCNIANGQLLVDLNGFGGTVKDSFIADGIPNTYYNRVNSVCVQSDASKLLDYTKKRNKTQSVTVSDYTATSTIKAGALLVADIIHLTSNINAASVGGADIKIELDVDNVFTYTTDVGAIDIKVEIDILSNGTTTGLLFIVRIIENSAIVLNDEFSKTGLDLVTIDYDLNFIVSPNTSGPIKIRSLDITKRSSDILE